MSAFKILGHDTPLSSEAIDPVCRMTVQPASAKAKVAYRGSIYYFCCAGCASKFQTDPEKYLAMRPDPNLFLPCMGFPRQQQLRRPFRPQKIRCAE